jgi:hypothetical protein
LGRDGGNFWHAEARRGGGAEFGRGGGEEGGGGLAGGGFFGQDYRIAGLTGWMREGC